MKFAHKVKHNGVTYLPGEDVPIGVEEVTKGKVTVSDEPNDNVEQQIIKSGGVKTTMVPEERKDVLLKWKNRELLEELSKYGIEAKQNERKDVLVGLLLDAELGKVKETEQAVVEVNEAVENQTETDTEGSGGFLESIITEE